jgi:hypothetical protein
LSEPFAEFLNNYNNLHYEPLHTLNVIRGNVLQILGEKQVNLINGGKEYLLRKVSAV